MLDLIGYEKFLEDIVADYQQRYSILREVLEPLCISIGRDFR